MKTFVQDPQAKLAYSIDWSNWLITGDTIMNSSWTAQTGIVKGTETKTDTITSILLSGGTAGSSYIVTNHISTASGLEDDRSFILKIRDR